MEMSKSEVQILAIRKIWEMWQEEGLKDLTGYIREKCRSAIKTRLILLCYGVGLPANIIAYALNLTVNSVYRRLNSDPIYYEQMKALRKTKMTKKSGEPHGT